MMQMILIASQLLIFRSTQGLLPSDISSTQTNHKVGTPLLRHLLSYWDALGPVLEIPRKGKMWPLLPGYLQSYGKQTYKTEENSEN